LSEKLGESVHKSIKKLKVDLPSSRSWTLLTRKTSDRELEVVLSGCWCLSEELPAVDDLETVFFTGLSSVKLVVVNLERWDIGLPSYVAGLVKLGSDKGLAVSYSGLPDGALRLLAMAMASPDQDLSGHDRTLPGFVEKIGRSAIKFVRSSLAMVDFLGEITLSFSRLLAGKAHFRLSDFWLEIEEVGPRALGIVSVISFLVGLILAYLGADQLKMVGAQIFIADLVAIGMVREVGALMTGIIIAGRTGAAFAAQLGTMQVNEEIDSFRTLGISPIDFLVLPRMLALMMMVPLLTLYSSFVGMLAGLLVSSTIFDIGMFEYYTETIRALELKHFFVGLSKGMVYGAMVAFSGCLRGIQCGRNAEAVGRAATSAVVTGILLITITASLMTIIFYRLGI